MMKIQPPKPGAVREMIVHNQVQILSQLFVMLGSSLTPTIVQNMGAPADKFDCALSPAVQSAIEISLLDVCERIRSLVNDQSLWTFDKHTEEDYYNKMAEQRAMIEKMMIEDLMAQLGGGEQNGNEEKTSPDKTKGEQDEQQ